MNIVTLHDIVFIHIFNLYNPKKAIQLITLCRKYKRQNYTLCLNHKYRRPLILEITVSKTTLSHVFENHVLGLYPNAVMYGLSLDY